MTDDLHDGFDFNALVGQVCHGTVPKVMEDEIFNLLFLAKPLNLPVGMAQFSPVLVEHQALNAHYPVKAPMTLEFSP